MSEPRTTDPVALRAAAKLAMRTGLNISKALGLSDGDAIALGERLSTILDAAERRGDLPRDCAIPALLVLTASTLDTLAEESTGAPAFVDPAEDVT